MMVGTESCVGGVLEIISSKKIPPQRGKNVFYGGVINEGPVGGLDVIVDDEFVGDFFFGVGVGHEFWWGDDACWVAAADPANSPDLECFTASKVWHGVSLFRWDGGECC